ncbi:MAG: SIR2 family protein [Bacteroidales bacterium]|nr:SIR2 family protein [Bacteroidales bacterium]
MNIIEYLNSVIENADLTIGNTVIVSGAGISRESYLPSGADIIKAVYNDFDLNELHQFYKEDFSGIVSKIYGDSAKDYFSLPRLEVIFNGIRDVLSPDEYKNFIFDVFFRNSNLKKEEISESKTVYHVEPNYNHYLLAEYIKQGGVCLTFNFDELIECAYKNLYGESLKAISFPMNRDERNDNSHGIVIKPHGTFHDNEVINVGIDTRALHINGFSDDDSEYLSRVIKDKQNIIFLGYSISDSLDFLPFLESYCKQGNKINVVFMKYDPSVSSKPKCEFYRNFCNSPSSVQSNYFQIDHYLKSIIKDLVVVNYFPSNSLKKLIQVPSQVDDCKYQVKGSIVSGFSSERKVILKLKLLETFGLLNRFGENELKQISLLDKSDPLYDDYLHYDFYKKNINGLYGDNVRYILKIFLKKPTLRYYNSFFGILNEYVFLTPIKKGVIMKLFALVLLLFMWATIMVIDLFLTFKNSRSLDKSPNTAATKRHTYLPLFRLIRGLQVLRKEKFITKIFGKWVLRRIIKSKKASRDVNDLRLYRFIEKERIRMEYILNGKTPELLKELLKLLTLNIDTNYFIDIANLFRLRYEITKSNEDRLICLEFTQSTNDVLNKNKIS